MLVVCKDLVIGRMVSPMECLLCVMIYRQDGQSYGVLVVCKDLVIGRMVSPMECLLCVKI